MSIQTYLGAKLMEKSAQIPNTCILGLRGFARLRHFQRCCLQSALVPPVLGVTRYWFSVLSVLIELTYYPRDCGFWLTRGEHAVTSTVGTLHVHTPLPVMTNTEQLRIVRERWLSGRQKFKGKSSYTAAVAYDSFVPFLPYLYWYVFALWLVHGHRRLKLTPWMIKCKIEMRTNI